MPRTRRDDIIFEVSTSVMNGRVVTMTMLLRNDSPIDYFIYDTVLFIGNEIHRVPIQVYGPSEVICSYMSEPTIHENLPRNFIALPKHETVVNSVLLSDLCSFATVYEGLYTVGFNGYFSLFESTNSSSNEYSWLIGRSSFVIGETKPPLPLSEGGSSDF